MDDVGLLCTKTSSHHHIRHRVQQSQQLRDDLSQLDEPLVLYRRIRSMSHHADSIRIKLPAAATAAAITHYLCFWRRCFNDATILLQIVVRDRMISLMKLSFIYAYKLPELRALRCACFKHWVCVTTARLNSSWRRRSMKSTATALSRAVRISKRPSPLATTLNRNGVGQVNNFLRDVAIYEYKFVYTWPTDH